ncbi:hypothetical protein [Rhodoplanes roseus]|uniref:Glycosyltransferase RgtA/B/C/D-like domain-containing protein n=1 Tax=Rhodoplanes roseus TaxID=29409 RepID=A0A327KY68_9BRAD|nr:hypothetical protein [Rhodoplanes roseus]RAI43026.1 hypothetical protein CH341_16485 [Rhodoplanes roseus]
MRMHPIDRRAEVVRPGSFAPIAIGIAAVVLLHRAVLWVLFGDLLDAAARANPGWRTWQYLPLSAYRDHFWASLRYLQQTPPLPHVLLGILLSTTEWPVGTARALYGLQAAISAGTVLVLARLLHCLGCGRLVAAGVALLFGLSTDLYTLEIASFGQLVYESAAMLLVAAACLCLARLPAGATGRRRLIAAGLLVAGAALTRASFSYLFVIVAVFLAVARGPRSMAVFLVPVVLLQGGWSLKTFAVYGHAPVATSSWGGINATVGYGFDPAARPRFIASVEANAAAHPDWFVRLLREHGYVHWHNLPAGYAPDPEVARREREIQAELGGTNRPENSITIRMIADQYTRALAGFARREPGLVLDKVRRAYMLFWHPMADYAAMFVGPIFVEPVGRLRLLSVLPSRRQEARAMTGTFPDKKPVPVRLPTVPLHLLDSLCILVMHVLLPVILLVDAVRLWRRCAPLLNRDLLLVLAVAAYGAVLFNLVEIGENMRFRLSVTPEVIAFSVGLLCRLGRVAIDAPWRLRTGGHASRDGPDHPPAHGRPAPHPEPAP